MDALLEALRAAAEPTRLRLLALAARAEFCVMEFTEILGQSQPRLSRHLKLLSEAGLLERVREGANAWFTLPGGEAGARVRTLLALLPDHDAILAEDRRQAARVLAERARAASDSFRRQGADWDEMRALDLPAPAVEAALLSLLPGGKLGRVLDIGTGTGGLLELLAPRAESALGIDASRAMLALARTRLARSELNPPFGLNHCVVRLADMYRLPLADRHFDIAVLQMVLHYAEDPLAAVREAARVLRPGGRLVVVDLGAHNRADLGGRLAHRWPGFTDTAIHALFEAADLTATALVSVPGPLEVRLWAADSHAPSRSSTGPALLDAVS